MRCKACNRIMRDLDFESDDELCTTCLNIAKLTFKSLLTEETDIEDIYGSIELITKEALYEYENRSNKEPIDDV